MSDDRIADALVWLELMVKAVTLDFERPPVRTDALLRERGVSGG